MNQFIKHNDSLRQHIEDFDIKATKNVVDLDTIDVVLRELLSIEEMKEAGSFFTGQILATAAVQAFVVGVSANSVILDPTCGAGNLLIECSRILDIENTLSETLRHWGQSLWGFDIHYSFIESTKLRIILEALNRGAKKDCTLDEAFNLLLHIRVRDALEASAEELISVTHTIMNPPFSLWTSPSKDYWKKGKVSAAGVICDQYIRILPEGCHICAILPDVLRSGSRYNEFREFVSLNLVAQCTIWGKFNNKTDVDVFILSGTTSFNNQEDVIWNEDLGNYTKLSSIYDVQVGSLVAYRDPQEGKTYPFFHLKNAPAWEVVSTITETRKFKGSVIQPPVVIVKRTSSPRDKHRASATLINLDVPVAIENHMIVIKPKSGTLTDCKRLLKILKSEETNDFLNKRIRLRHLTVGAIKDIPI